MLTLLASFPARSWPFRLYCRIMRWLYARNERRRPGTAGPILSAGQAAGSAQSPTPKE
jgi:hypothetical protein